MSSAICFKLDQSKNLLPGNELKLFPDHPELLQKLRVIASEEIYVIY